MKNEIKRRRHVRCQSDIAITFSLFNKTKQNQGIARNVSRSGIYFETTRKLSPGMLLVIRNNAVATASRTTSATDAILSNIDMPELCREMKNQVVGEVKRCLKIMEGAKPRYGVAVSYLSPAV